jgi:hypothetical protein
MYNWSTDIKNLKRFPNKFRVWRLESLINFGLGNEKIDKNELISKFESLDIDPQKRKFLKFLLS